MQTRGERASLLVAQLRRKASDTTAFALSNALLDMARPRGTCAVLRVNGRFVRRIDSYPSVLDAQRAHIAAQQRLVPLHLAKLASRVRLYGVLGGGAE